MNALLSSVCLADAVGLNATFLKRDDNDISTAVQSNVFLYCRKKEHKNKNNTN